MLQGVFKDAAEILSCGMTDQLTGKLAEATAFLATGITHPPTVAVVLGSGLSNFVSEIHAEKIFDAENIPHYPASTVAGHQGKLVFGTLSGKPVAIVSGRVHLYEGRSADDLTFYVKLLAALGIRTLILTNAAGGLNPTFDAGDICLITDHVNLLGDRFAIRSRDPLHQNFYDADLQRLAKSVALENAIDLKTGIYLGFKGPTYETKSEVRMMQTLGGDAVGMSTVPEVIAAADAGLRVLALSLITNKAAGLSAGKLSHTDVTDVANRSQRRFATLLKKILEQL
jgi:purine-nucleoside phosphorylase